MMRSIGHNDLVCYGDNKDVVRVVCELYNRWKEQPKDAVAPELYNMSTEEACRSLFTYLVENVRYKLDTYGCQYIKSPARLLADGNGDCKSLTMFFSCCLHCLGISHIIRFVNFDGGDQFSHVYCVAIDGGREIVLDACELDHDGTPVFNYARPYAKKLDFVYYE